MYSTALDIFHNTLRDLQDHYSELKILYPSLKIAPLNLPLVAIVNTIPTVLIEIVSTDRMPIGVNIYRTQNLFNVNPDTGKIFEGATELQPLYETYITSPDGKTFTLHKLADVGGEGEPYTETGNDAYKMASKMASQVINGVKMFITPPAKPA